MQTFILKDAFLLSCFLYSLNVMLICCQFALQLSKKIHLVSCSD